MSEAFVKVLYSYVQGCKTGAWEEGAAIDVCNFVCGGTREEAYIYHDGRALEQYSQ